MREIAPGERRQFQAVLQEAMEENIATRNRQTPRPEVIAHVQARRFRGGNFGSDVSPKRNQELANKGRADETPVIPGCSPCKKSLSQIKFILRRVHIGNPHFAKEQKNKDNPPPTPGATVVARPAVAASAERGVCRRSLWSVRWEWWWSGRRGYPDPIAGGADWHRRTGDSRAEGCDDGAGGWFPRKRGDRPILF